MMSPPSLSWRPLVMLALVMLAVLAGKIYTIGEYAPLRLGDNYDYIAAADEILGGSAWLSDAGLDRSENPPTLYRPIGYSLIVAAAKGMAGESWPTVVAGFQAVLSFLAGLLVLRLALAAGLSLGWSALVFLLHQWSVPLSTDALIMEDGVMGALGTAALCMVLLPVVRGGIPSTARFAVAGLLVGAMFFLREVFHFCMPIVAVLTFLALVRRRGVLKAALAAAVLVLPVLLASHALKSWNEYRVGVPVAGTGGQTAYAYALVMAMRYDPTIAAGDQPIQIALRETNKTFDYVDARAANAMMYRRFGMNSVQQLQAGERLFWTTLSTNPLPLVKAALVRIRPVQQATLFAGPLTRIDDLDWWALRFDIGWRVAKDRFLASWNPAELTVSAALNLGLRLATRAVGMAGFLAFALGVPWVWLRSRRQLGGVAHAMLVTWGLWGLFVAMYIPVSFEMRYLGPLIGPALLAVAVLMRAGWPALRGDNKKRPA